MDFHGIEMKGKYYMEEVSSPTASPGTHNRRVVYNTSATINGAADYFGGYKMYYHNNTKWVRPLLANVNDGPDIDNSRSLGTGSYRFAGIYSTNFYGAVRYS